MLGASAVCLLLAGSAPTDWLESLGSLVRRVDDVTPERMLRGRQLCWAFGLSLTVLGCSVWHRSDWWARQFQALRTDAGPRWLPADATPGELWAVAAILAVGVGLRLAHLGDPMAYDEAYSFLNFARRPWYEAIGDYNSTNNHLLNTLLMHVCYRLFGSAEWALRLPVFCVGCLLPYGVWRWGRDWCAAAAGVVAAGLCAAAPALITYSTDARGYVYVTLAAVVWDAALGRLHRSAELSRRTWLLGVAALTFGLCAMPIMLYSALAGGAWFLAYGLRPSPGPNILMRLRWLASMGLAAAALVTMFYAPAYIFRGLMFLRDPIMRPGEAENFFVASFGTWREAWTWWTAGAVPPVLWGLVVLLGIGRLALSPFNLMRWASPFVVVVAINLLREALAPPRIFLWLIPWVALAAAAGIARRLQPRDAALPRLTIAITAVVLVCGIVFVAMEPVLIDHPARVPYESVPDVVQRICAEVPPEHSDAHRIAAPLPTDLPMLFYLARAQRTIAVNGEPRPGETLWIITRREADPETTLADGVVQWSIADDQRPDWDRIADFATLSLFRSRTPLATPPR